MIVISKKLYYNNDINVKLYVTIHKSVFREASNCSGTEQLQLNEVATKAMRDEMISVDRYGNIIDSSVNQHPQMKKKSLFHRIFKKK